MAGPTSRFHQPGNSECALSAAKDQTFQPLVPFKFKGKSVALFHASIFLNLHEINECKVGVLSMNLFNHPENRSGIMNISQR
jgi:hypothetical protein